VLAALDHPVDRRRLFRRGVGRRAIGYEFENLRAAIHTAIDNDERDALGAMLKPLYWWAWLLFQYYVSGCRVRGAMP